MENIEQCTETKPTWPDWCVGDKCLAYDDAPGCYDTCSKKPQICDSTTDMVDMGQRCGKFYITVDRAERDGKMCIVRIHISAGKLKSGTCAMTHMSVLEQLINHKLSHGSSATDTIAPFLMDIVCEENRTEFNGPTSCHDAVGRVLAKG